MPKKHWRTITTSEAMKKASEVYNIKITPQSFYDIVKRYKLGYKLGGEKVGVSKVGWRIFEKRLELWCRGEQDELAALVLKEDHKNIKIPMSRRKQELKDVLRLMEKAIGKISYIEEKVDSIESKLK